MTRTEKAWLAGIVDGEGTFVAHIRSGGYPNLNVRIAISNRHPRLMEKARALFSEIVGRQIPLSKWGNKGHANSKAQPIYVMQVWRIEEVAKVARTLLPHLVGKRDQAVLFAEYLEKRGSHRYIQGRPGREDMMFARRIQSMNARFHWSPRTDCMGDRSGMAGDEETVGPPRIHEGGEANENGSPQHQ